MIRSKQPVSNTNALHIVKSARVEMSSYKYICGESVCWLIKQDDDMDLAYWTVEIFQLFQFAPIFFSLSIIFLFEGEKEQ